MNRRDRTALDATLDAACARIAPTWPLDRYIAVNPWWGWIDRPMTEVDAVLGTVAGTRLTPSRREFAAYWHAGGIVREHLVQAIDEAGVSLRPEELVAALDAPAPSPRRLPLLSDALDALRDAQRAPAWADVLTHQLGQHCAAHFDAAQAEWQPDRDAGLYAGWLAALHADTGLARLMDAPWLGARAAALPATPRAAIEAALRRFEVNEAQQEAFFVAALMRIGGWAAWCAGRRWQARLDGGDDTTIVELLAARLGWELVLDDGERHAASAWARWRTLRDAAGDPRATPTRPIDWLWQRALEIAWQAPTARALAGPRAEPPRGRPEVQAIFCIDVRSEVFRRALEHVRPATQTHGFAGFFGLPLRYAPLGTTAWRPQLPGLLAPSIDATDVAPGPGLGERRRERLDAARTWSPLSRLPASAFTRVEALGFTDLGRLLARSFGRARPRHPDHAGLGASERSRVTPQVDVDPTRGAELAASVLRALGLDRGMARLVLFAGHGSGSANNPHAAGLDCGACCGQTGEVNARALANLLNDPAVRAALAAQGLSIPHDTWFLAAVHDTTLDEVELFDLASAPPTHAPDIELLRQALAEAGSRARLERAPRLGLAGIANDPARLRAALHARAADWSQTRPEWGLADNAGFVVAPRARTRGLDLAGRCFLHDYDHRDDPDGSRLEGLMTAPMLVTHWINLQYHASCVDPRRYGAGNKVLHNVVGGTVGVFEGNGGDLRIGLPWQSVHDGTRFMHTPRRLSVFIEAPEWSIEAVIARHAVVRQLVVNGWLHLFRIDPDDGAVQRRDAAGWTTWAQGIARAA
jgi:uncharacterized protein YbcC (UPF0753/DUF2309 family)